MSQWDQLRKRGDWMVVWGKAPKDVSNSLRQYFTYNFSRDVVYSTSSIPGGVFIVLAHMPDGAVEAYENRKKIVQNKRIEAINQVNHRAVSDDDEEDKVQEPIIEEDDDYDPMAEHDGEYGIGDESD